MKQFTGTDLESFVAAKSVAAIHFDAEWDVTYRPTVRARMLEAEKVLNEQANFGEVDVDQNQDLAKAIRLSWAFLLWLTIEMGTSSRSCSALARTFALELSVCCEAKQSDPKTGLRQVPDIACDLAVVRPDPSLFLRD